MRQSEMEMLIDLALIVRRLAPPDDQKLIERRLNQMQEDAMADLERAALASTGTEHARGK